MMKVSVVLLATWATTIALGPSAYAYPTVNSDDEMCASLNDDGRVSMVSWMSTYFKLKIPDEIARGNGEHTNPHPTELYSQQMVDAVAAACPELLGSLAQAHADIDQLSLNDRAVLVDMAGDRNLADG